MQTKIKLSGMKFYAYHGVMPQERKVGNHFQVDLTVTAPLQKAVLSDDLTDTLNYAALYAVVAEEMSKPSLLIEHVAGRILKALKHQFPGIEAIDLELAKLNPPFGGDLISASVLLSESYN